MTEQQIEQKDQEAAQTVAEQKINNAKAASEIVTVQAVPDKPKPVAPPPPPGTPLQPKSFSQNTQKASPESDADKAIRMAENSQNPEEKDALPENQDKLEQQIAGSSGMWDSQLEMEHITGKLVDPKQYRSKKEIEAEKKLKEKQERDRIRNELLAPDHSINDDDTRLYSGYLAGQAKNSKSDVQIVEEKQ